MRSGVFRGSCSNQMALRRLETRMAARTTAWVGIDIGKTPHWMCAVDAEGRPLLSLKVANVEADLQAALAKGTDLAEEVGGAVDIIGAPSALILALLAGTGAQVGDI